MSSRPRGRTRPALVAAARAILVEHGPAALTLRAVGARLGVSAMAAYRHFADKDALLAEVAEEGYRDLAGAMRVSGERARAGSRRRLVEMGVGYVGFAVANPSLYRVMFDATLAARAAAFPGAQRAALEAFQLVVDGVRSCQTRKVLAGDDPLPPAMAGLALAHGFALLCLDRQLLALGLDAAAIEDMARRALSALVAGFAAGRRPG